MSKTLIVYYSRKGENYVNGSVRNLAKGNTEIVAEMIADMTGGDLFEIDTVKPYAADYYTCIDEAKVELRQNARPELKAYPDSLDEYDAIFVGYPNWWHTTPTIISTFLESYDFSGKTMVPFFTSGGGGAGKSDEDMHAACAGRASWKPSHRLTSADSDQELSAWIDSLAL